MKTALISRKWVVAVLILSCLLYLVILVVLKGLGHRKYEYGVYHQKELSSSQVACLHNKIKGRPDFKAFGHHTEKWYNKSYCQDDNRASARSVFELKPASDGCCPVRIAIDFLDEGATSLSISFFLSAPKYSNSEVLRTILIIRDLEQQIESCIPNFSKHVVRECSFELCKEKNLIGEGKSSSSGAK